MPSRASRPPNGATAFGERPEIGGDQPDHAGPRRHLRIARQPADMALAKDGGGGDVAFLGLFDRQPHRPLVGDIAEAPMTVHDRRGRRFLDDDPRRAGDDMAGLDAVDIGRDLDDPMRIVPDEIGADDMAHDERRLVLRRPRRDKQRAADFLETVCGDLRHCQPPLNSAVHCERSRHSNLRRTMRTRAIEIASSLRSSQ